MCSRKQVPKEEKHGSSEDEPRNYFRYWASALWCFGRCTRSLDPAATDEDKAVRGKAIAGVKLPGAVYRRLCLEAGDLEWRCNMLKPAPSTCWFCYVLLLWPKVVSVASRSRHTETERITPTHHSVCRGQQRHSGGLGLGLFKP